MKFLNSKVSLKGGGPLKSIEFDILRHLRAYLAAKPPSLLTCAFREGFILGFVNERLAGQFIMVLICNGVNLKFQLTGGKGEN